MTERNYYVICDDNCRFEGMTKEQVYDAIAEATGMTPTPIDSAFITKIKEQNAEHNMKFWKGTEAQYNALEERDTDTVYIVSRATGAAKISNTIEIEERISELEHLTSYEIRKFELDTDPIELSAGGSRSFTKVINGFGATPLAISSVQFYSAKLVLGQVWWDMRSDGALQLNVCVTNPTDQEVTATNIPYIKLLCVNGNV